MWQRGIWTGLTLLAALLAALVVGGCSFDDGVNGAHGCDKCAPGMCVLNYCLQPGGDGGGTGGDGSSGNGGDGRNAANAGKGGDLGSVGSSGQGGNGTNNGPCVTDAPCYVGSADTRGTGVCTDGKSKCDADGVLTCEGQVVPGDEQCNELDDDCDGEVDEEVMLGSCELNGTSGGACGSGVLKCEGGKTVCADGDGVALEEILQRPGRRL